MRAFLEPGKDASFALAGDHRHLPWLAITVACLGWRRDMRYNRSMSLADSSNPASWLAGTFLLILLATYLLWFLGRTRLRDEPFRHGPVAALGWLVLALCYLLPTFLGLRKGVLSPYVLGLTEIDWPATLSSGLVLAAIIVGGTLFGWLVYRRSLPEGIISSGLGRLIPGFRAPVDALLQQWHWAFYRAAATGWLMLAPLDMPDAALPASLAKTLQGEPLYWGAWIGLAVVALEWLLDPYQRAALQRPGDRELVIRRAALAVATAGLFVLTRNLWLCLIVHLTVEVFATGWFPLPAQAANAPD